MNLETPISRRRFLGEASCRAVGATALFSSLLNLRMTSTAAAQALPAGSTDYKALVCLFLAGGNDSFNMLVPRQAAAYATYAQTRDNLALALESLLPVTSTGQGFSEFGLHPSLTRIQQIYNAGKAAFVANMGTLVRPTTLADYNNKKSLPQGLFSHSDQQMHWQTLMPQVRGASPGGWGGRTADLLHSLNDSDAVSMSISFAGSNVFQVGKQTFPFMGSTSGFVEMKLAETGVSQVAAESLLDETYAHLFHETFAAKTARSIDASRVFRQAVEPVNLQTVFPSGTTAAQFKMVARTIAAHQALGVRRQTFFVRVGGWDHHSELLTSQNTLLGTVDAAVGAFWDALGEIGARDQVVLFTASDFGRTLTSNALGTDHAWGGNYFVLGGPVKGGKVYGQFPSLTLGNPLDTGRGRLIPTTSVDAYCAEMASWFGVPGGELETLFPNCKQFFDPQTQPYPLGYL